MANHTQAGIARLAGASPETPPRGADHRAGRFGDDYARTSPEKKIIISTLPEARQ